MTGRWTRPPGRPERSGRFRFRRTRFGRAGQVETRMLVVMGAVGIVIVVIGLVLAVALPRGWYLLRTDSYTAEIANAAGLTEGDPVLVAGVPTGRVESVSFAGDHVDVGFRLDDGRPLGAQTTASVRLETVLGKRYLDVHPAGHGSVGPDRTIPLDRTTVPYSLDELAASATDTAENLDVPAIEGMVTTLGEVLPADSQEFRRAVAGVSAAAEAMGDDRDRIDRLLTTTKTLAGLVASQDTSIEAITTDARTLLGTLADRRQAISGLVDDVRTVLGAADRFMRETGGDGSGGDGPDGGRRAGDLDALIGNLRSVTGTLERNGGRIDQVMETLPAALRSVADATGNGNWVDVSAPAGPIPDTLLCVLGVMQECR